MQRFTTITDVYNDIRTALGEYAEDHDIEAIADEAYEYRTSEDADGNQILTSAGFEQIVDTDDFWAIAEKHAK